MKRRWSIVGAGLLVGLTSCLVVLSAAAAGGRSDGPRRLSKDERALVAEAKTKGESSIVVMIAANPGAAKTVASGINGLGGRVGYVDEQLSTTRG